MNTIEDTIFARKRWLEDKMLAFGFEKEGQEYCYECDFSTMIYGPPVRIGQGPSHGNGH